MIYAYDEIYLADAMKNLGEAFDYSVNGCQISADEFWNLFITSGIADSFGKGNPKYLSGLSGTELVMEILTKTGLSIQYPEPQMNYDYSIEYWCGWILAYYQWRTARTFNNIHDNISGEEILKLYYPLHEAAEEKFVDTVNHLINQKNNIARIQQQRKKCGYSQKELAKKAGVNLRTLQQYELKSKDINKAAVQTALALAKALGCQIQDILEYSTNDDEE